MSVPPLNTRCRSKRLYKIRATHYHPVTYNMNTMAESAEGGEAFWQKQTVPAIKKYLKEHGATAVKRKKAELIGLAVKARKLNLEPVGNGSESALYESRRAINGDIQSHPCTIPESAWSKNLRKIPSVTLACAFTYCSDTCGWDSGRVKRYRDDLGWQLHKAGHVHDVMMHGDMNAGFVYVKGKCTPTTRLNEKPYDLWIMLKENGDVVCGERTCVA